jgi:hypothetical protein
MKIFTFLEEGQDVLVAPARITEGFPFVVILGVAANVEHVVKHAGPAKDFPAWPEKKKITSSV